MDVWLLFLKLRPFRYHEPLQKRFLNFTKTLTTNDKNQAVRIYGLLTKCEVKMAGYWPSSFFACLWTEAESRSINMQKRNEANIKPSWPNKLGQ